MAASKLEEEILDRRVGSEELSDALEERKLDQLNNGSIVDSMMKDKDLKKIFDDMGDKPINPNIVADAYRKQREQKELEEKDSVKYLTEARAHMVERFGQIKIDKNDPVSYEKTFELVMRYGLFCDFIKSQANLPPTDNPQYIEERFKKAKELESDAYRIKITEERKRPFREAFEALDGRKLNLEQMHTAMKDKKLELEQAAKRPGM